MAKNVGDSVANAPDFLQQLMKLAVKEGGADPKSVDFSQETGMLTMKVKGQERRLCPGLLIDQFAAITTDTARLEYIRNVVKTYVSGTTAKPANFQAALPLLKPRLQTAAYFRAKCAELPSGDSLPFCTVDGGPGAVLLKPATAADALGVCVVCDFGHAVLPVLASDLQQWDTRSFEEVLAAGLSNLAKGCSIPTAWKFGRHQTGCCQSEWTDGFDSTRVALLPALVQGMNPGAMPGAPGGSAGGVVAVFASHAVCLAGGSKNPVSLCFMGDLALKAAANPAHALSTVPYRLVECKAGSKSPAGHPLAAAVQGKPGMVYSWARYRRGEDEFSVPTNQDEIDAVLDGMQTGKVPVFEDQLTPAEQAAEQAKQEEAARVAEAARRAAESPAQKADRLKKEGNAFFGKRKWAQAKTKYTEALAHTPSNHLLHGNRAMCCLKLEQWTPALADATQATALCASWSKGWARKGAALSGLKRPQEALQAYHTGLAVPDISENEKVALTKSAKELEALLEEEESDDDDDGPPPLLDQDDDVAEKMSLFSLGKP